MNSKIQTSERLFIVNKRSHLWCHIFAYAQRFPPTKAVQCCFYEGVRFLKGWGPNSRPWHGEMQVVSMEVDKGRLANTCMLQQACRQQRKLTREVEESAWRAREESKLQHIQEVELLRQEKNKTMLHEYSQYRNILAQQQAKYQSEEIEMAKHHRRPSQMHNLERVKYRQQELLRKQEEALRQEEMLAEEERQREQQLQRLRALVSLSCMSNTC
jgi:hypothetical protein